MGRRGAAGHDVPRTLRHRQGVRRVSLAVWCSPPSSPSARRGRITMCSANSACGSDSPKPDELGETGAFLDSSVAPAARTRDARLTRREPPVAAWRRTPDPVRGRRARDAERPRPALSARAGVRRRRSDAYHPGSRLDAVSAQPHLTGERAHDLLHAGRTAAGHRQGQDSSRRRACAVDCRRRFRPDVQRPGRGSVRGGRRRRTCDQARCRCPRACGRRARSTAPPPTRSCPTRSRTIGGGACFNDARVQVELMGRH